MEPEKNVGVKKPVVRKNKQRSGTEKKVVVGSVVIALAVLAFALLAQNASMFGAPDAAKAERKWQAVFLTNGQVYFGHLTRSRASHWKLTNVYYPQQVAVPQLTATTTPEQTAVPAPQQQPQTQTILVKLTQELQQPEDTLFIPSSSILFWQNLRNDSTIIQTITGSAQ
ncbi:MAG: hypothetical protein AAB581_03000 [Patescibacteria group bacterium]